MHTDCHYNPTTVHKNASGMGNIIVSVCQAQVIPLPWSCVAKHMSFQLTMGRQIGSSFSHTDLSYAALQDLSLTVRYLSALYTDMKGFQGINNCNMRTPC